ncbi:hypothetical protein GJ688_11940 [Heliobacillus mobilis]|uniref:Transketolase-like pyrimidine-binding domain-containing protein n=1 Tax=Heliobacterium mobile TaxID=28064 RepID=A0A6I3SLM8_HELMO|nr:transketolase C-terminal domain-containing protein [Heliobacterium mobile]MTV49686.1 hypothetical protein [Heliobacterium mobile]
MDRMIDFESVHISEDIRDAFFDQLHRIAEKDARVMLLTADMSAFSLERYKRELPQQYVNVGIAEQNLINIAAGLAKMGKKVFVYGIAPFVTMRCYEQIKIVTEMNLDIHIIGAGAGLSYGSDGYTHHAVQDIGIMRLLRGLRIYNPSDSVSSAAAAYAAYYGHGPSYTRIDKGRFPLIHGSAVWERLIQKGVVSINEGTDVTLLSTGFMVQQALAITEALAAQSIQAGLIDVFQLNPLCAEELNSAIGNSKKLVTIEEHERAGGLGTMVSEWLVDQRRMTPLKRVAIDAQPQGYGDRPWLHQMLGLDTASLTRKIMEFLNVK